MTLTRSAVRALLDEHGLSPSRALGQNFLVEPATARRIAEVAGVGPGDRVVEVGAGLGSLTLALVEAGASVTAIEADRHLVPVLRSVVADAEPPVDVVEADATRVDWADLLAGAPRWVLAASLPYNVATPLVLEALDAAPAVERLVVMVQREAGERLVAAPGSRTYGIPSVKVAYHATGRIALRVPPTVFLPRPRVDSVVVELTRRSEPPTDADPDLLFELVRSAFGQRRKMLRRSLAGLVAPTAFEAAGVAATARPEELDVVAWGALARAVGQ